MADAFLAGLVAGYGIERVPSIVVGNLVILALALAILADAAGISLLP